MNKVKVMDNTTEENVWTDAFNIKNIYYAIFTFSKQAFNESLDFCNRS